ncbi:SDR family oxidoreductase [Lentilitoribacter sp. Alg239-R112]|uniref:SDR family NAD(P)-dependent oxidoreductase n=1 Tax=Lentilitoribacter sp. Alg239-R112 TaxID=2305987 RepID=UPI0013A6B471|nr:SDR family oxidoreductase [Lentilitoribacter sp. Alg239-R112]
MNSQLRGKVALISGSSRGIGKAIAHALHSEGCKIVLNGRDPDVLIQTTTEFPDAISIVGDVCDPVQAAQILNETIALAGKLDILVCNVGSGSSVPPGSETHEEWQRVFAINVWSTTNLVEAALPALAQSKGSIVCISSICGNEVIPNAPVTYSVAKAALNAYVRGIARPLGDKGVRINAIAPGNILSGDSVWSRKLAENKTAVENMLEKEVPMKRLGTPEEIGHLVTYLSSPLSEFATGSVWTLDGGQTRF